MIGKNKKNKDDKSADSNRNANGGSSSGITSKNGRQPEHESSSIKRTNFTIPNEVKYVVIGIATVAIIWFGLKAVLQVNNPFYVVSSESMVPTLMVGDLVVLRNGADGSGFSFSDLQVGDIIVYHSDDGGGRTIVHRIVEIYQDNEGSNEANERLLKTKGDNNPVSYEGLDYPIREADYHGKVISIIPKVGLVTMSPYNYIIAGIAAGLVSLTGLLGYIIYQRNNEDKK